MPRNPQQSFSGWSEEFSHPSDLTKILLLYGLLHPRGLPAWSKDPTLVWKWDAYTSLFSSPGIERLNFISSRCIWWPMPGNHDSFELQKVSNPFSGCLMGPEQRYSGLACSISIKNLGASSGAPPRVQPGSQVGHQQGIPDRNSR